MLASREELPADRGMAQLGLKIRMGDADQQLRPSTSRLALDSGEEDVDDRRRAVAAATRDAGGYFVADAILGGDAS